MSKIIDVQLGMTAIRSLVYDFLDLPHYRKVKICNDLGLKMNEQAPASRLQFHGIFAQAFNTGKLSELAKMVDEVKK